MKSVLVVEDDKRTNEIICDYLEMSGYRVQNAYDGCSALRILSVSSIDLAIIDIMMPGMDGFELSKRIGEKSDCFIMFLTARSEEADKLKGFEHGAVEYVTKPFSPKVLVARVDALFKLKGDINTGLQKGDLLIDMSSYLVEAYGKRIELTSKEYELLFLLIRNEGRVMKRDVIIQRVWGYDYFGDGRVLDTYIKTLRKKLMGSAKYIKTVIGIGYKFEVNEND